MAVSKAPPHTSCAECHGCVPSFINRIVQLSFSHLRSMIIFLRLHSDWVPKSLNRSKIISSNLFFSWDRIWEAHILAFTIMLRYIINEKSSPGQREPQNRTRSFQHSQVADRFTNILNNTQLHGTFHDNDVNLYTSMKGNESVTSTKARQAVKAVRGLYLDSTSRRFTCR